jgi:hypothetical protein
MENQLHSRHGDLVFKQAPIPTDIELTPQKAPIILAGRESAPHTIAEFQHVLYGRREGIQFLRVAEPVEVSHSERHRTIPLQPGDYHVASLAEMNGELARAIED